MDWAWLPVEAVIKPTVPFFLGEVRHQVEAPAALESPQGQVLVVFQVNLGLEGLAQAWRKVQRGAAQVGGDGLPGFVNVAEGGSLHFWPHNQSGVGLSLG